MATTSTTAVKRKRPPTFQHLPVDRAKKLKKSWVEAQKIKSKWKAQKRKEGLVSAKRPTVGEEDTQSGADDQPGDADEDQRISEDEDQSDADMKEADIDDGDDGQDEESSTSSDGSVDEENAKYTKAPRIAPARGRTSRGRGRGGMPRKDKKEEKPSFRELSRLAYSRESLHTYKSQHNRGDQNSRGRGRGSFTQRGRGRGQPDMRLRMNVMLEKIKRDLA
ncbi:hypothetical protein EIP86_002338 [Pleurotus ostreatoroseus]|nr:hypothetical protein EIP86_002338 [Pleurotus ostreatoroseus]